MKFKLIITAPFRIIKKLIILMKRNKFKEEIEKEFVNGKVLLPQEKRDYDNYSDFRIKSKHIESINNRLVRLHGEE